MRILTACFVTSIFVSAALAQPDGHAPAAHGPVKLAAPPATSPAPAATPPAETGDAIAGASIKWQSLTRNGSIQLDTGQLQYTVNLQGYVVLPAAVKVLGVAQEPTLSEVLGADGQPLTDNRADIARAFGGNVARRRSFNNVSMHGGGQQMPVYINLNQISSRPTKIGSLKGYATVLIADKQVTKVVDAVPDTAYTNVVDGAEFKIDQVNLNQNQGMSGNVTITFRKQGNAENPYGSIGDAPALMRVEAIDDQGAAMSAQYVNTNMRSSTGSQLTIQCQAQFQSQTQGGLANIKTIRLTFAVTAVEKKIPFELKDIPLP